MVVGGSREKCGLWVEDGEGVKESKIFLFFRVIWEEGIIVFVKGGFSWEYRVVLEFYVLWDIFIWF